MINIGDIVEIWYKDITTFYNISRKNSKKEKALPCRTWGLVHDVNKDEIKIIHAEQGNDSLDIMIIPVALITQIFILDIKEGIKQEIAQREIENALRERKSKKNL